MSQSTDGRRIFTVAATVGTDSELSYQLRETAAETPAILDNSTQESTHGPQHPATVVFVRPLLIARAQTAAFDQASAAPPPAAVSSRWKTGGCWRRSRSTRYSTSVPRSPTTLREAIAIANNGDTINFAPHSPVAAPPRFSCPPAGTPVSS